VFIGAQERIAWSKEPTDQDKRLIVAEKNVGVSLEEHKSHWVGWIDKGRLDRKSLGAPHRIKD